MKNEITQNRIRWIQFLLVFAALIVYWPVGGFDFVNYDDPHLVSANPAVAAGLTWRGFWWGLTTSYFEFWHPVTWWSHMLDQELFGPRAGWHHLMSLAIHVANTLILFAALQRLTGALWRSAIVAALFALHPTHVESVAWLAERKDLLCGLFIMITLWAYAGYASGATRNVSSLENGASGNNPSRSRFYWMALGFFALALMSKPMAVTLPFVLLLLDYWPLNRFKAAIGLPAIRPLLLEKIPFFGLTVLSCAITFIGVKTAHNVVSTETFPWTLRLANVPVSYARYLEKLIWPDDLIVLYRMPTHWPMWQVIGAVLLVLLVTAIVLASARSRPYCLVGWLMFLGMLVPTIGLVPVGFQSIADRYTYIPYVGVFLAVIWAIEDISREWSQRRIKLGTLAVLALMACGVMTALQVQHWRNSFTLWTHCLAVDKDNATAHYNLGHYLHHSGREAEAMPHYREALRIKPDHLDANMNLGVLHVGLGQVQEATNFFARALKINPHYDKAHVNMGLELYKLKDYRGATNHMSQAMQIKSNDALMQRVCALALIELGNFVEASNRAADAVRLAPDDYVSFTTLGRAASALGQSDEALRLYAEALRQNPTYAGAHRFVGVEWLKRGEFDAAIASLRKAVQLDSDSADTHFELGLALAGSKLTTDAVAEYREALKRDGNFANALNNLAWMLATHPDEKLRNGAEAVQLAERACKQTSYQQVIFIGTLAAAYAEAGDFEKATTTAQRACDLARATGQTNVWEVNQKLLKQYQERRPYREQN